jgi:hypothetical protein
LVFVTFCYSFDALFIAKIKFTDERQPTAVIRYRALRTSPFSISTAQQPVASSYFAEIMRREIHSLALRNSGIANKIVLPSTLKISLQGRVRGRQHDSRVHLVEKRTTDVNGGRQI